MLEASNTRSTQLKALRNERVSLILLIHTRRRKLATPLPCGKDRRRAPLTYITLADILDRLSKSYWSELTDVSGELGSSNLHFSVSREKLRLWANVYSLRVYDTTVVRQWRSHPSISTSFAVERARASDLNVQNGRNRIRFAGVGWMR